MKYLNDASALNVEFHRLMNQYDQYYWMVAWAGKPFSHTIALSKNTSKIKNLVVGLHFYQTHPDFIEQFMGYKKMKFMAISAGTFHPKVYLFSNSPDEWEAIIGSANFTNSAFNINNEAGILITNENASKEMYNQIKKSIIDAWDQAKHFDQHLLKDYRKSWERNQSKLKALSQLENKQKPGTPYFSIPIVATTWTDYIRRINAQNNAQIEERIKVLDFAQQYFRENQNFADMDVTIQQRIAGYKWANQPADFRLFGNMNNAGKLKQVINNKPDVIGKAIDIIPLIGEVTKDHYDKFVELFQKAVDGGNKYRSATRLLAMKRPDVFFAISTGNNQLLADDFQIKSVGTMNLERYWDEVVDRIQSSHWYQFPKPKNAIEQKIAAYRVAFMDVLYYRQ